jgi:chaperonin GroEL
MNFNKQEFVKDLSFGDTAKTKILGGVAKLTEAVKSTLGASGKCVIIEDNNGDPIITKDGVTVANSITLLDPIENIGATLIKEAARKTVREAGDGTTTATVLANAILRAHQEIASKEQFRGVKVDMDKTVKSVLEWLENASTEVNGDMIDHVATISANNDVELGEIIGGAFKKVGKNGIVMMETSETAETYVEVVEGVQLDKGLKSQHLITDIEKQVAVLDNPLVLLVESTVSQIRKIQGVLEFAIKANRPILIVGDIEQQPYSAIVMNKLKGVLKVVVIDPPHYGIARREALEDLAALTGATIINEDLGDDIDLISDNYLGTCTKVVAGELSTVITIDGVTPEADIAAHFVRDAIEREKNKHKKERLERRLAMLTGSVAVIKVGANSDVELKEKKDRVDDAIHATKAAVKSGIVPGGGVALLNAADSLPQDSFGAKVILTAIMAPFYLILDNANIVEMPTGLKPGDGLNVVTGKVGNMVEFGIVDPLLVTKSALTNAYSVASTILSTDCVINNIRDYAANR